MKKLFSLILAVMLMFAAVSAAYCSEEDSQLLEKYRSLINALEQRDFDSARAELDRYIRESSTEYQSVAITSENWADYFDIAIEDHYDVDVFGNPVYFTVKGCIRLKDEYANRLVWNMENTAHFNVYTLDKPIQVIADFENKSYKITFEEPDSFEKTSQVSALTRKSSDNEKTFAGYFSHSGMSYRNNNGDVIYYVDNFLDYKILQAVGTIWLYNE